MKNCLFKKLVFMTALTVGLAAVALVLQFERSLPEIPSAPVVEEKEESAEVREAPPSGLSYDKARADEIIAVLKFLFKDKNNAVPFDQAVNLLRLEGVSWDDVTINAYRGGDQTRMYHFRGFYLVVSLQKQIPGNPDSRDFNEIDNKGIVYVHNLPSVHIDGLEDPKERMRLHDEAVAESVRRMLERVEKEKKTEAPQR